METFFLLPEPYLRQRTRFVLESLAVQHMQIQAEWWSTILEWLDKYARHEPDLCDAMLVVASATGKQKIWTYDAEFAKIWRTQKVGRWP